MWVSTWDTTVKLEVLSVTVVSVNESEDDESDLEVVIALVCEMMVVVMVEGGEVV